MTTLLAVLAFPVLGDLTEEQIRRLPPSVADVEFGRDIAPLLEQRCVKCHGRGKSKGGFRLDDRELFLRGGDSGPAIVPGKSVESYLVELVAGVDPDNFMPLKGSRLSREEVGLVRGWIDRGAPWAEDIAFYKPPTLNMEPRRPLPPVAPADLNNPVDRFLHPYFAANKVEPGETVDDRTYARRVYLDILGLLPPPEVVVRLVQDTSPMKREALVEELLADGRRYAEHWLSFWNDLLRNDYKGTGFIDNGRKQISSWLFSALQDNLPYDRFVSQLIDPNPESEGFIKGIVWRGVVNASQRPEMQAAQNISQVFMGVNLKCASCHDSFINDWTLAEAYGLANVFAAQPLEIFRCDKPTGKVALTQFLYPELGAVDAAAPLAQRREQLARILTSRKNGRLSRTIVNRLWARFMGRGLVEPLDDMQQPAWHPDLLDWLAEDLGDEGFDLKRTMKLILTSRAYQLPSVDLREREEGFVFTGPGIRRMSAEQFRDALATLTGVWAGRPAADFDIGPGPGEEALMPAPVKWIWSHGQAASRARPETVYLRREISLGRGPDRALAVVTCDNGYTLFVNGKRLKSGHDFTAPALIDMAPHLRSGLNVIALQATNDSRSGARDVNPDDAREWNPAGAFLYVMVRDGERVLDFGTDAAWVWSAQAGEGWEQSGFDAADWKPVAELGAADSGPWNLGPSLSSVLNAHDAGVGTRAALVASDPLTVAFGRPPREQVVTRRATVATTLQALELTNGETLNRLLKSGAENLLGNDPPSTELFVTSVYRKALGRSPGDEELALAREFLGEQLANEQAEDFLWSVVMLPEFQLIY